MNQATQKWKNKARKESGSIHEERRHKRKYKAQTKEKKARRKGESAKEKNKTLSHLVCAFFFSFCSLILSALSLFMNVLSHYVWLHNFGFTQRPRSRHTKSGTHNRIRVQGLGFRFRRIRDQFLRFRVSRISAWGLGFRISSFETPNESFKFQTHILNIIILSLSHHFVEK